MQWTNQRLIEKRLTLYDTVAPQLNALLCFYTWIGYWKDISPDDVIRAKRELDRTFHIYRYLFDDDVYDISAPSTPDHSVICASRAAWTCVRPTALAPPSMSSWVTVPS